VILKKLFLYRLNIFIQSYKFEDTIIIGRDKSCNIVINDPLVSRRHAKITLVDGQKFYIEDLNSTNGTYINNNPVMKGTKKLLKQDDEIRIGNTVLIFNFF
jgi:pSer/pThr/pTyr-binding forkhead associated (FHA) protein